MAVLYDAESSSNTGNAPASTLSWSHTMGSGAEGALVVAVDYPDPDTSYITGVTFDSVALTYIGHSFAGPGVNNGRGVEMWYLLNPTSGTHNIVVSSTDSVPMGAGAISATGVSSIGTYSTNNSTSATSLSVTTSSGSGDMVVGAAASRSSGTLGQGGSQTQRYSTVQSVNISLWGTTQTGGSSVTSSFTQSGAADYFAIIAVPVTAASVTISGSTLMTMGVG